MIRVYSCSFAAKLAFVVVVGFRSPDHPITESPDLRPCQISRLPILSGLILGLEPNHHNRRFEGEHRDSIERALDAAAGAREWRASSGHLGRGVGARGYGLPRGHGET